MSGNNSTSNNCDLDTKGGRPAFQIVWQHVHKEKTADDKWLATCSNCGIKLHYGNTKPQATKCSKHIIQCSSTPDDAKIAMVEASNSTELKEKAIDLGLIPPSSDAAYASLFDEEDDEDASGSPKKKKAKKNHHGKRNKFGPPKQKEYRAAIELMSILDKEDVPITAYNKIMEWHLRHSGHYKNKSAAPKQPKSNSNTATTKTNNQEEEDEEEEVRTVL